MNLYSNMFALANYFAMSPVTPSIPVILILFALAVFYKYKNLVLGTPGLKIGSYVTINNIFTIIIYDQLFTF